VAFLKRINYLGRFVYLFVLVSVFISILSIGVFYFQISKLNKALLNKEAITTTIVKQKLITYDFDGFKSLLVAVTQNDDFTNFLKIQTPSNYKKVSRLFQTLSASHPFVMQLRYLDKYGQEKIRVDRQSLNSNSFIVEKDKLQDKSERSYFIEASTRNKGELYVSKLDLNIEYEKIETPHKPVIRLAIAIFKDDKHAGIVIVNIFMKYLLEDITASSMFHAYIYDQDGYLLTSNNTKYQFWNRYLKQDSSFHDTNLFYKTKILSGVSSETLYLGLNPKKDMQISLKDIEESLMLLIGFVIPIGFILAYFLAKIPKRLYDELENREKTMIQQSKMSAMGEMIGAIAHQWRQPLNAIGVLTQEIEFKYEANLLEKDELKTLNKEMLSHLDYMSNTINDFRDFFKPDKEKIVFNIHKAIEDSLKIIGKQLEVHDISVNIEIRCEDEDKNGLDHLYEVNGYESEFKQVIINLINNAREAIESNLKNSPSAKKEISVIIDRKASELAIYIRDTGGGIKKEILNSIFDIYISSKHEQQGTGLGLYMSKLIIERNMLGKISAKNIQGGAEFEILLFTSS